MSSVWMQERAGGLDSAYKKQPPGDERTQLGEAHSWAHTFPTHNPWDPASLLPTLRNKAREHEKKNELKFDLLQI